MTRRRTERRLGFAGVGVLGVFLIIEGVLRILGLPGDPTMAADGSAITLPSNPWLLWELAPGVRREGDVVVHVNRLGLRGPEPRIPKPPGVRRIVATGDSTVYGFGVADADVFVDVAAEALGGPAAGIEGWTVGVPGYSTFQTLNLLEMRGWRLEPDVLIIANIWSDHMIDAFVDRDLIDAWSRFDGGWAGRAQRVLARLNTFRLLDRALRVERGPQARARAIGWKQGQLRKSGPRRVSLVDYTHNLTSLAELARSHGAEPFFLLLPSPMDVTEPTTPFSWDTYRAAMRQVAVQEGAPLLDGADLFHRSGLPVSDLFLDNVHPSALGHALLGHATADALRSTGLVPGPGATAAAPSGNEPVSPPSPPPRPSPP